jgi:hypothetical protein
MKARQATRDRYQIAPDAFAGRLEAALQSADTPMLADEIAAVEDKILTFNIPKPITIHFEADFIPLYFSRWMAAQAHTSRCPNCRITLDPAVPAQVKVNVGCPGTAPTRDFPEQVLVCGCGESQDNSPGYYGSPGQPGGREKCDFDASFHAGGPPDFHTSYSHLHFTPPRLAPDGVHVMSVTDEARRLLNTTHIPFERAVAAFIHSDCGHMRGNLVQSMIDVDDSLIDRWGGCWNNRDLNQVQPEGHPESWYWHDSQGNRDTLKTEILTGYPFGFALENTLSENYFTEKRYEVFAAGAVPIVWKNHNSVQHLPGGAASAVFPEDFGTDGAKLAAHLRAASPSINATAYAEYMAWKAEGIQRAYVRQMFDSVDFLTCRICEQFSLQVQGADLPSASGTRRRQRDAPVDSGAWSAE